jgi:DNA-binding GntR family transcriptional regulator
MRVTRLAARNFPPQFEREFELALFKQKAAAERKEVDEFFALDNEFHQIICRCASFGEVWKTIHYSTGQLDRVRRRAFALEQQFLLVFEEHQQMYESLRARDEDGVAKAFQVQLDSTFPSIEILRRERPELLLGGEDFGVHDIR